ncbi:hypothetical protein MNBD_ALPHA05-112, partial [hydrothermal vent metagenome]
AAKFFEPCGQPAHIFHLTEEPLDDVALCIKAGIVRDWFARIALRWNDRKRSFICYALPNFGAPVCLISNNRDRRFFPIKKSIHHLAVVNMTTRDFQPQRATFGVYGRMNFTCATVERIRSTVSGQYLAPVPPFCTAC